MTAENDTARLQAEVERLEACMDDMVTKPAIEKLQAEMRDDIDELRTDLYDYTGKLRTQFGKLWTGVYDATGKLRAEINGGIQELLTEVNNGINKLHTEPRRPPDEVRRDISNLRSTMRLGISQLRTDMWDGIKQLRADIYDGGAKLWSKNKRPLRLRMMTAIETSTFSLMLAVLAITVVSLLFVGLLLLFLSSLR